MYLKHHKRSLNIWDNQVTTSSLEALNDCMIVSFFNLNNQIHGLNQQTSVVVELRDWKETLWICLIAIQ